MILIKSVYVINDTLFLIRSNIRYNSLVMYVIKDTLLYLIVLSMFIIMISGKMESSIRIKRLKIQGRGLIR